MRIVFDRTVLLTAAAIGVSLLLGTLFGAIFTATHRPSSSITLHPDVRPTIPVIRINGIEDGKITGSIHGNARLFLGDVMPIPDGSGAFRIPAGNLFRDTVTVRVPAGMRFVASRRGKKYYPVRSANAAKLAPANRVYFADAESALRAGYSAGQ